MKSSDLPTIVTGRNPVREMLERTPESMERVLLQQNGRGLGAVRRSAAAAGVPVQMVPLQRIRALAGNVLHQGVVAICAAAAFHGLEDMLAAVAPDLDAVRDRKPRLLMLDRIEDPRNFGALVRTAAAAGVKGIIVPSRNMAPVSPLMVKASAGTALRIPIARTEDLATSIEGLKERGYFVAGAVQEGGGSVWKVDWDRPLVLIVGSEGAGIHPRVASQCDFLVSIPMPGDVESLNVSVAAGIILFTAISRETG